MDHEQDYTLQLSLDKAAVSNMLHSGRLKGLEILAAMIEVETREAAINFLAEILIRHDVDVGRLGERQVAELLLRDARARSRGR